ncbi:MAG: hypothetical protein IT285_09950 [Bdellovibrionales bacterium]|nr:hypothetical protein [Bdellovibrionales bacterium]
MKASGKIAALTAVAGLALGLSGCDAETKEAAETLFVKIARSLGLKVERKGQEPAEKPTAGKEGAEGDLTSANAKKSKEHAELLQEVFRVVYIRDVQDNAEFGSLVDTLNQGASLEGIYNGLTHSAVYRKLEIANPSATPRALSAFGEELARLTLELARPTKFDPSSAKPLATPVQPGLSEEEETKQEADANVIDFGSAPEAEEPPPAAKAKADDEEVPAGPKPPLEELAAEYSRAFVGASIFTLKRILGDEALKVMAVKQEYREKFALWYSNWVLAMAAHGVDFGIALRNKADSDLHYAWALKASQDRLQWEVLNRLHRLMNDANQKRD